MIWRGIETETRSVSEPALRWRRVAISFGLFELAFVAVGRKAGLDTGTIATAKNRPNRGEKAQ